jgi:N-acetylneuraminic acid mutarotase
LSGAGNASITLPVKPIGSIVTAAFIVAGVLSTCAAKWEKLPPLPVPIGGLVCGAADGKLVVVGGTNWPTDSQKQWLTSVYQLDLKSLHWHLAGLLKQPHAYGVGATVDGAFVVVGGSTGSAPFAGIIRVHNGTVSQELTGGITIPSVLSAGGRIGEEIILVGGTDDAANNKGFGPEAHAWNLRTGKLRRLPPAPRVGFGSAGTTVVGGELFVFGGAIWNERTGSVGNVVDACAYSPRLNAWRVLSPLPQPVRGIAAIAIDERYIYLGGGYGENGFTDHTLIYDLREGRYRPAPALPYAAGPHLAKAGGYIYCLGGEDRMKHRSSAAYRIRTAELSLQEP